MLTDAALLERYSRMGDADAFAELVRRYAGLVYGTCLRVTGNPQDAEDVAQECFLELARKAGTVRSSLPGWLHKVSRNRAINAIRENATRRRYEEEASGTTHNSHEPSWAEIMPIVDEALERLPGSLREPVILHFFVGLTQAQVAAHLDVSQSKVSRDLDKAIKSLRRELKKAGVLVTVGTLAGLLSENASASAPNTLMVTLNKIAISGIGASGTGAGVLVTLSCTLGELMSTFVGKTVIVSVVAAVTFGASYGIHANRQAEKSSTSVVKPQSTPTIQTILAALQHQNSAHVRVVYTMQIDPSPSSGSGGFGGNGGFAGERTNVPQPVRTYIRTPEVLYKDDGSSALSSEREGVDGVVNSRSISLRKPWRGSLSTLPGSIPMSWSIMDRIDQLLLPMFPRTGDGRTWSLYGWLKYGKVSKDKESIDGHDCWKIDVTDTGDSTMKRLEVWVDPKIGYNPRQMRKSGDDPHNGTWDATVKWEDYREIAKGLWFPAKQSEVRSWPKGNLKDHGTVMQASELSGNRKYSKDELIVKFPSGAEIIEEQADGSFKRTVQP